MAGRNIAKGQFEKKHTIRRIWRPIASGLQSQYKIPVNVEPSRRNRAVSEEERIVFKALQQMDRLSGEVPSEADKRLFQLRFTQQPHKFRIFRNVVESEFFFQGIPEQQVAIEGHMPEKPVDIVKLHCVRFFFHDFFMNHLAHLKQLFHQRIVTVFREHRTKPPPENIVFEPDLLNHADQCGGIGNAISRSIFIIHGCRPDAVNQIFTDASVENERMLGHKSDVLTDIALGQPRKIPAVDQNLPLTMTVELTDQHGQRALAAAGKTDERRLLSGRQIKTDILQQVHPILDGISQAADLNPAVEPIGGAVFRADRKFGRRIETFHDAAIPDTRILKLLIIFDQLLPGVVDLLIGRQKRDERPQGEPPTDGQISPDEEQNERSEILKEIVGELDAEFHHDHAVHQFEKRLKMPPCLVALQPVTGIPLNLVDP